jgi:hypothetical protein
MKNKKIDVLNLETEKKSNFKKIPLVYKIIAVILIIILFFIPVLFI